MWQACRVINMDLVLRWKYAHWCSWFRGLFPVILILNIPYEHHIILAQFPIMATVEIVALFITMVTSRVHADSWRPILSNYLKKTMVWLLSQDENEQKNCCEINTMGLTMRQLHIRRFFFLVSCCALVTSPIPLSPIGGKVWWWWVRMSLRKRSIWPWCTFCQCVCNPHEYRQVWAAAVIMHEPEASTLCRAHSKWAF